MVATEQTPAAVSATLRDLLERHLPRMRGVPRDADPAAVSLPDLGLDSMSAIELVLAVEETFGARFPEELLVRETFASPAALEAAVLSLVLRS